MLFNSGDDWEIEPKVLEGLCRQILRSEPLLVGLSDADHYIAHIGAWFDRHEEYQSILVVAEVDGYCAISIELWE